MEEGSQPYSLVIPASTGQLVHIRDFVSRHAASFGMEEKEIEELRLAIDEACSNVIKHAYENDDSQKMEIRMGKTDGEIWITITDQGRPFDPATYTDPDLMEHIKGKKRGGFGIYLIRKFMDKVEYSHDGVSNELRMIKKV